mgnify:CR=1 FL=1
MKKVLLISIVIALVALTGCVFTPATYVPTVDEQTALDMFANDSTVTLDTVDCVIMETIDAMYKASYVDTAEGIFADSTVAAKLAEAGAALAPDSASKIRVNVMGSYLSGYAKITMAAEEVIDLYVDIHGSITIWDANGDVVDYDVYGMSAACAMVFKGATAGDSVVREHYTYTLPAGDYVIRFKKAENATFKGKNYFFAIVG